MRKIKLLIATGIYPPSVGGPATYSFLLRHELPKHGIVTEVYSFDEVRDLPKVFRHIVYFFGVMTRALNADVVYAQDPVSVGLPSAIAAFIVRKRFIVRIAGDYAWEQGSQRFGVNEHLDSFSKKTEGYPQFVSLLKKVETWVARRAEKVIVPSVYLKRIVTNWGIEDAHVRVIYNAIDDMPNFASRMELRQKYNLKGFTIFSAGRLVLWKGFDALIEIMPDLLKVDPTCSLFIAGDGPHRPELKRIIANLHLDDHVFLVGRVSREVVLEFAKAADIFILNTYYEGFSHQLLEVMTVGTPVVATREGGNPELVTDCESGLLIKYNDKEALRSAILKIKGDKRISEKLVKCAFERTKHFTKERMIKDLLTELS